MKGPSSSAMSSYAIDATLARRAAVAAQQAQQQYAQQYAQLLQAPPPPVVPAAEDREGLPYSRKPRPVDYQPYDIKVGRAINMQWLLIACLQNRVYR